MPIHKITMSLPAGLVVNSDVEFVVMSGSEKLGELHLSKGSLDWRPKNSKKTEYRLSWERFAQVMATEGRETRLP
jgi:hypothetical protein